MSNKLEDIKAALNTITPGKWHGCHEGNCPCGTISSHEQDFIIARTELNHYEDAPQSIPVEVYTANAKFIANAPDYLRLLLPIVEAAANMDKSRLNYLINYLQGWDDAEALLDALKALE